MFHVMHVIYVNIKKYLVSYLDVFIIFILLLNKINEYLKKLIDLFKSKTFNI